MISEVLDTVEECRSQSMALSTCNDMIVPVITRSLETMQTALQDTSDQNKMLRAIASLKNECNLSRQFDASVDAPRDLTYRFFHAFHDFMNLLTTTGRLPISEGDQLAIEGAAATDPIITFPNSLDRITFDQTGVVPMPTNPTSVDQTGTVHMPHDPTRVYQNGAVPVYVHPPTGYQFGAMRMPFDPIPVYQNGGGIPFHFAHTTGYQPGAVPFNLAPTTSGQTRSAPSHLAPTTSDQDGTMSMPPPTTKKQAKAVRRSHASSKGRKNRAVPSSLAPGVAGSSRSVSGHKSTTSRISRRIPRPIGSSTPIRSQSPSVPFHNNDSNLDYSSDQAQHERCEVIVEEESIMIVGEEKGTGTRAQPASNAMRSVKRERPESEIEDEGEEEEEENENLILVVDGRDVIEGGEVLGGLSSMASFVEERTQESRSVQIGNDDNVGTVGVERSQTRGRKIITAKSVSREAEKDDREEQNVVVDTREEEEEMVEEPQGALKCRRCSEFATNIVCTFVAHLKAKHSTTLTKEGLLFRCECGHECRSASHANSGKCRNKKVVLIGDNDDDLEAEEDGERVDIAADANTSGNEDQLEENMVVNANLHLKRTAAKNSSNTLATPAKKPKVVAPQRVMSTRGNGALKSMKSMKSIKREKEEEERESKKINNFECTPCQFSSGSAAYYLTHLRKIHNSTMKQNEKYFRCECGHKSRSGAHSRVCPKVSLIVNESDEPFKSTCSGPFVDVDD